MQIVEVCKYMGWTYTDYEAQPDWFINLISLKMNLEGEYQNKQTKNG